MLNSKKCPFSEKECPVLSKNLPIEECPLAFGQEEFRECSLSFIARNLDGIYKIMHQWVVDWQKEKGIK